MTFIAQILRFFEENEAFVTFFIRKGYSCLFLFNFALIMDRQCLNIRVKNQT